MLYILIASSFLPSRSSSRALKHSIYLLIVTRFAVFWHSARSHSNAFRCRTRKWTRPVKCVMFVPVLPLQCFYTFSFRCSSHIFVCLNGSQNKRFYTTIFVLPALSHTQLFTHFKLFFINMQLVSLEVLIFFRFTHQLLLFLGAEVLHE